MNTFTYNDKEFLMNGKPYTIISGAMHYWRIVPEYWEDRLLKLKACGFNTVETYTAWNLHERTEGKFNFSGNLDIVKFISTAEKIGLNVIIRPGPYICSEFDFGGLPSWLLKYPNIRLRCSDASYLDKVRPYYRELLTRIRPHLCTNGGGVIMMQIENEYGSYGDDKDYMYAVADIYKEYGINCTLFTSDGAGYWMLSGGTLPEYLSVANFGSRPDEQFAVLKGFKPNQPLMCGEFWCGWFDHWGEEHHVRGAEDTTATMKEMLDMGASFNFYMFHGGTNFAFTNGANYYDEYLPTVTSYDYCSPLSESGDMTPTYFSIKKVITDFTGIVPDIEVKDTPKAAYGKLRLTQAAPLFENLNNISSKHHNAAPLSMEEIGQDFGYILYSTKLKGPAEERELQIEHIHDRAHIFIDGKLAGIKERCGRNDCIKIALEKGEEKKLDIFVENCGRVNYGPKLFDKKGIVGGVRLDLMYHFNWDMYSMTMDDLSSLEYTDNVNFNGKPMFLKGTLDISEYPADTFLRLDGFHKGFVVINGFNLGRYWNDKGPQKTLFVPAPVLKKGNNEIIVFETDGFEAPIVEFFAEPDLG